MKKRNHRFLVGYRGDNQTLYGYNHFGVDPKEGIADPMTERQAKRILASMPVCGALIWEIKPTRWVKLEKRRDRT